MNCEYCIYYEQCIKILKEKDEEIDLLKKNYIIHKETNYA